MLRTSSGDLAAAEEGWELSAGSVAAVAAVRAATIPGARFARGTLRGRPALVVWTEAAWRVGAGAVASAAVAPAGPGAWAGLGPADAGWAAPTRSGRMRSALTRSGPARRLDRPGGGEDGVGASGSPPGGDAGANGVAPPGGGPDAPGVLVGSEPVRARAPAPGAAAASAASSRAVRGRSAAGPPSPGRAASRAAALLASSALPASALAASIRAVSTRIASARRASARSASVLTPSLAPSPLVPSGPGPSSGPGPGIRVAPAPVRVPAPFPVGSAARPLGCWAAWRRRGRWAPPAPGPEP